MLSILRSRLFPVVLDLGDALVEGLPLSWEAFYERARSALAKDLAMHLYAATLTFAGPAFLTHVKEPCSDHAAY